MTKFKVLTQFIKDMSSETKDVQTYLFVKDYISKYQLSIDITSKSTKNKLVEITTTLKFEDKQDDLMGIGPTPLISRGINHEEQSAIYKSRKNMTQTIETLISVLDQKLNHL